MPKRFREQRAKPGQLKAYYGTAKGDGPDVCFAHGGAGADRADSRYLYSMVFTKEVTDELIARGYDITTLHFSIMQKQPTI